MSAIAIFHQLPGPVSSQAKTMTTPNEITQIADRFATVASRFCSVVDSAPSLERSEFAAQVYRMLPRLIDAAIGLPNVQLSDDPNLAVRRKTEEWNRLYISLKEKLEGWDSYRQVFDPTQDAEAIYGSLADDIADIYGDLKRALVLRETPRFRPEDLIWECRLAFHSHWGKHAMDALLTIHFRLQDDGA